MELPSFKINTKLRDSNGIKKIVTGVLAVAMMLAPTVASASNYTREEIAQSIHTNNSAVERVITLTRYSDGFLCAYHSSHVSHASHASHSSHYSCTPGSTC